MYVTSIGRVNMNKKLNIVLFLLLSFAWPVAAQVNRAALEKQLKEVIAGKKAEVGIAVILNGRDTLVLNNDVRYPMMSVFKFHQALSVAHYLEQKGLPLTTPIHIRKSDLKPNTYSPLRDKYPEGDIDLPVGELLTYTVQLSDNNACDILFDYTGGTKKTDRYIRSLGIDHFAISHTEDDMHRDLQACYQNWTSPLDAARLVELFITRPLVADVYQEFIKRAMITCETGKDRLSKPLLHTQAVIGHKTGTGDRNAKGQLIGINDIGFVRLPDGQRYTIAVFVKDSEESAPATEQIIADLSKVVYEYVKSE